MQPVPGADRHRSVAGVVAQQRLLGRGQARRVRQLESVAVQLRPARTAVTQPSRCGRVEHPVAAHAPQNLDPMSAGQVGDPGQVVARVEHEHRGRTPLQGAGLREAGHYRADLRDRGHGGVVVRPDPRRVQHGRPGRGAPFQPRGERERPTRNRLARTVAATRRVAVTQPLRRHRVRTRPRRHVYRDLHRPGVDRLPRPRDQCRQRGDVHFASRHRVIQRSVTAPECLLQRQLHQRRHRTIRGQYSIDPLEQRVRTPPETLIQLQSEIHQRCPTRHWVSHRHRRRSLT